MMRIGELMVVHGDVEVQGDLVIEGRVRGHIRSDRASVRIEEGAEISGDIVARTISVGGQVTGTLTASDLVEIEPTATVKARVISSRFVLKEGAFFSGPVHVQRHDATSSVARYRAQEAAEPRREIAAAAAPLAVRRSPTRLRS